MYDRPVPTRGLLWRDLLDWWRDEQHQAASDSDLHSSLYSRLHQSLSSSPPERLVFRTYFDHFRSRLGDDLPALIPQVYLHYDPYTMRQLRELGAGKRLPRQRMDFLMLLPGDTRAVLEVDGQQHYATDGRADPQRYAGMVSEDRRLRFAGYEVYRFGGYELNDSQGPSVVIDFFERLFSRHGVV